MGRCWGSHLGAAGVTFCSPTTSPIGGTCVFFTVLQRQGIGEPSVYHAVVVIFLEFFAWGLLTTPMLTVSDSPNGPGSCRIEFTLGEMVCTQNSFSV